MIRLTLASALLASTASIASAAGPVEPVDPVIAQPLPVTASFWEGGYAGVQLGYSYGDFDVNTIGVGNFDDDSVIGGVNFGYLFSVGNGFYVGPEFQYDFADITVTDPGTGGTASFDSIARLKLIAGYEVGDGLVYGSAGVAYADFDGAGALFSGFSGDDTNFVVGVGYDYRVGDNWTVGGEYQFHRFNDIGAGGEDVDVNTLHVKATYRF